MKCRVCGNELDPTRSYCPKCGSKVLNSRKEEPETFSWNTMDFPKPKQPKDIEMKWPEYNTRNSVSDSSYMTADASEGFVQQQPKRSFDLPAAMQPESAPVQQAPAQPAAPATAPAPVQESSAQPNLSWTMPSGAWQMPAQQQVVIPPAYGVQPQPVFVQPAPQVSQLYVPQSIQYTAPVAPVATIPQIAPVQPAPPVYVAPQPVYVAPQPAPAAPNYAQPAPASVSPVASAAPASVSPVAPAAPAQPAPAAPALTNIDEWLDTELQQEESNPDKERFFTFYKKNEEFQHLLDQQYEKFREKHHEEAPVVLPQKEEAEALEDTRIYVNRKPEKAFPSGKARPLIEPEADTEELSDFDKMLMADTKSSDEIGSGTLSISAKEIKSEIADKEIEKATAEAALAAKLQADRKAHLEQMARAREAYFGAIEAMRATGEYSEEELNAAALTAMKTADKRALDAEKTAQAAAENAAEAASVEKAAQEAASEMAAKAWEDAQAIGQAAKDAVSAASFTETDSKTMEMSAVQPVPAPVLAEEPKAEPVEIPAEPEAVPQPQQEPAPQPETSAPQPVQPEPQPEPVVRIAAAPAAPLQEDSSKQDAINSIFEDYDNDQAEKEAEKEKVAKSRKRKHGFGRFISTLLIIILGLGFADLAVVSFMPAGPLVDVCNNVNEVIFEEVDDLSTQAKDLIENIKLKLE